LRTLTSIWARFERELHDVRRRGVHFDLCLYDAGMDPSERCAIGGLAGITRWREWSFVTFDHPTFETGPASGPFWDRVIEPFVNLKEGRNDIYHWLELVFTCEGKPFVYYSAYRPSARIHALARSHKVQLRWCPLSHLSSALRARHGTWRQLRLGESQWRQLQVRLAAGGRNRQDPYAPLIRATRDRPHPRKP
jgi:hypothetical protein